MSVARQCDLTPPRVLHILRVTVMLTAMTTAKRPYATSKNRYLQESMIGVTICRTTPQLPVAVPNNNRQSRDSPWLPLAAKVQRLLVDGWMWPECGMRLVRKEHTHVSLSFHVYHLLEQPVAQPSYILTISHISFTSQHRTNLRVDGSV